MNNIHQKSKPRQMRFNDVARWGSRANQLPKGLDNAWEWVEQNLAKKKPGYTIVDKCNICSRSAGNYKGMYTCRAYKWSGWDREHKMFAHVNCGCDQYSYCLPETAFVDMVM